MLSPKELLCVLMTYEVRYCTESEYSVRDLPVAAYLSTYPTISKYISLARNISMDPPLTLSVSNSLAVDGNVSYRLPTNLCLDGKNLRR